MEFRKIRIADLIPASYNPRKKLKPGDKEYQKIKNSITEFGYVEPVIVNSDIPSREKGRRVSFWSLFSCWRFKSSSIPPRRSSTSTSEISPVTNS